MSNTILGFPWEYDPVTGESTPKTRPQAANPTDEFTRKMDELRQSRAGKYRISGKYGTGVTPEQPLNTGGKPGTGWTTITDKPPATSTGAKVSAPSVIESTGGGGKGGGPTTINSTSYSRVPKNPVWFELLRSAVKNPLQWAGPEIANQLAGNEQVQKGQAELMQRMKDKGINVNGNVLFPNLDQGRANPLTTKQKKALAAKMSPEQRDSLYGRKVPDGATLQKLKLGTGLTTVVDRDTIEKHMAEGGIIPGSRNEGWRNAEAAKAQAVIDKRNAEITAKNNSIFGISAEDLMKMASAKPEPGMKFSDEIQQIRDQKWAKSMLRMMNDNQNAALEREDRKRQYEVLSQKYGAEAADKMLKAERAAKKDKLKEIRDRLPDSDSYNQFLTLVGMSPAAIRKAGFNPLLKDMDQMDTSVLLDAYLKAQDQVMNMDTTKSKDLAGWDWWRNNFGHVPTYESVLRNAYLSNLGIPTATQ